MAEPEGAAAAAAVAAIDGNAAALLPHNPRARKLRSAVWNDFTKERRADGSFVAVCHHCKRQLTASSRSGTTHLKNHLATCLSTKRVSKRRKLLVRRLLLKPQNAATAANDVASHPHFDQEVSRQDLARMIVQHGYRFSIVDDVGFRAFVRNLQPNFKITPYEAVKIDCMRIYESAKLQLREVFDKKLHCRVSISVDMWRSKENVQQYMSLTCHYIEHLDNEWKLKKKFLNFVHIDASSTGEDISRTILDKFSEWSIDKKLVSIVLDNCTASELVGRELLRSLRSKGFLVLNGDLLLVRSCACMLNLIIQEGIEFAAELINRVRACVHYVKSSEEKFIRFQKAAETEKPLLVDSPDGWAPVFVMLEAACHYQEAFTRLAEWDPEYQDFLSSNDWAEVKALTECLDILYHTMEKLSGTEKPTSNLYFNEICGIHLLLKTWCDSRYSIVASMASHMFEKFEQYWGVTRMVMAFASILDPRYKMKSVEYFFKLIYTDPNTAKERIESIRKCFTSLYNEYAFQLASKDQTFLCYVVNSGGISSSNYANGAAESKTFSRSTLSDAQRGLDQYLQETSSGQTLKSDLDMYFEEAVYRPKGPSDNFDILAWWKSFAAKYPVLSAMARDILAIPVSIVPLDNEARILNEYLSPMDPMTVEALVCAQDWLKEEVEVGPVESLAIVPAVAVSDVDVDESIVPVNGDE
ncbi:zinc finger BED domain-containing protein RICESLEEPER 1-like isoform X2 [Ananas comosus]|uniref:Zinc finger BED domain-containing protein RICESLEEPER 1-like isoform X2 n=1 Tax=Ananas comosus TaxID=4615 RepID=A0A6P5FRF2_ANACO|nr:zinc finger BED domain-containing protein RICESLEEPER 1-like isoform X2 [Ananas comosus]